MPYRLLCPALLLTFVLAGCLAGPAAADGPGASRPNIVFIMADDLGYGDLGCYGQQVIQTPAIDRLATEGMRFTHCYAGSTVCAPSRSVLMTGLHTGHTTVRGNNGVGGVVGLGGANGRVPLRADDITVAHVLKQAGYATGMAGKWGLGEPNTTGEPGRQGFDDFFGYLNQRRAHHYFPDYLWHNRQRVDLPGNAGGKHGQYSHALIMDHALAFIREHRQGPFFLYLPICLPHDEYEIPSTAPYNDPAWTETERAYAAMVSLMDRDVGRVSDLLAELGLADNTLLFFCSDNGAARRFEGRFGSSGPLRGAKRDMYDGGLRTPMIVRWPGQIAAGSESHLVWSFADVLPTLADAAGADSPPDLDGQSVLPSLLGESQDLSDRYLYWEFFEAGFQQAARRGKWKAVRLAPGAELELYDLESDPGEENNLADARPEVVQQFEAYLKTARTPSPNWPTAADDQ